VALKKTPRPEAPREARPRRIDVSSDIEALRAELTEIFSRVYLANAHNVLATIVFIYGVTSLAALGGMVPYIRETTALSALSNAWQPGCALYARFSTAP
jgi:hypothetical protein